MSTCLLVTKTCINIFYIYRTESTGGGPSTEAAIALVGQLFPSAILEENFADRLVFSVPQSSVSSLARCFQQIEDGECKLNSFSRSVIAIKSFVDYISGICF